MKGTKKTQSNGNIFGRESIPQSRIYATYYYIGSYTNLMIQIYYILRMEVMHERNAHNFPLDLAADLAAVESISRRIIL